jgi:hypothetical protein
MKTHQDRTANLNRAEIRIKNTGDLRAALFSGGLNRLRCINYAIKQLGVFAIKKANGVALRVAVGFVVWC